MILADNEQTRTQVAETIRRGGVIAFRTDTFYGLGADPFNRSAVSKIRQLKGRGEAKPILVLIADFAEVDRFIANRSEIFDQICERLWPGPLTLIGQARPELPDELAAGTGTIGVRLPAGDNIRDLIRTCGGALTATSANVSGKPAGRNAVEVASYFPSGLDLIIDGGEVSATAPSTVLDVTGTVPRVVREGAISKDAFEKRAKVDDAKQ
jgi:L-threonylcarbamoyladenylate synthase